MEIDAVLKIPAHALPWIIVFIIVLLILGFLAWTGYDNWWTEPR